MEQRISNLDILRGIAALSVVLFHYTFLYPKEYAFEIPPYLKWNYGFYGVHLFFIISGFVIYKSIRAADTPYYFMFKRGLRLYPTYWICVMLTFAVVLLAGLKGREVSLRDYFLNLTMLQGMIGVPKVDGVYWSLTFELFFYLLMAVFMLVRLVHKPLIMLALWIVAGFAAHVVGISFLKTLLVYNYLPYFAMGIIYFVIWSGGVTRNVWIVIGLLVSGIIAFHIVSHGGLGDLGAFFILQTIFVFFLFQGHRARGLHFFSIIGIASYAFYLIHQNIGYVIMNTIRKLLDVESPVIIVVPMVITFGIAYLITYKIEKPLLREVKRKLNVK